MEQHLPLIFGLILALAVILYVVLDGFDLGVGILFPFAANDDDRTVMMNTVAPVWDGNETWLVLGGGGLLAAFPAAYAVFMPALYIPVIVMVLALVFRGVAFEFRARAETSRSLWNVSFALGSAVAAFAQGVILGGYIQGITTSGDHFHNFAFAGGPLDWLTPFSLMCGLAVVCGYGLLGACWLMMKTEGALKDWARDKARVLLVLVAFFVAVVSIWTPLRYPEIAARWFQNMNFAMLFPVPVITLYCVARLWLSLKEGRNYQPFFYTVCLFLLSFFGLGISFWPYVVPPRITLTDAAATPATLWLLLIGVATVLPVITFYTIYVYRVFHGKVRHGDGYH
jgi:cytochrome d ubiquinol oxidase subunit II